MNGSEIVVVTGFGPFRQFLVNPSWKAAQTEGFYSCWKLSDLTAAFCHRPLLRPPALVRFPGEALFSSKEPRIVSTGRCQEVTGQRSPQHGVWQLRFNCEQSLEWTLLTAAKQPVQQGKRNCLDLQFHDRQHHFLQGLKLVGLGEGTDVSIKELPVSYVKAQQIIAEIWQTLHPKFAIHLGVARGSSVIILEQTGRNSGYRDKDVCGFCPESHCCVEGGQEKLDSVVNMRAVAKEFKQAGTNVIYSRDAGRYLCDFAYYCSLYHGQRRAALIHVPSSGSLTSADKLVPLLQTLIHTMLEQLEDPSEMA